MERPLQRNFRSRVPSASSEKCIEKVNNQEDLLKRSKNPAICPETRGIAGFFAITSGSVAHSSILMILRGSLFPTATTYDPGMYILVLSVICTFLERV